ncbi:MAG TPA: metallophosphoesterase [Deferrisomatales bacterium]|nr:metallophosphoesterase [Deferrisomatales bacterium]
MRVGLLSDTHLGQPEGHLRRVLAEELGDAEVLLHAGDHTGDAVIGYLEDEEPRPYLAVAGNMDLGVRGRALPARRVVQLNGVAVGLVHGWGAPAGLEQRVLEAFGPDEARVVVFGHSHRPLARQVGDRWLVNPGSAFHPRGSRRGSVALLTLERDQVALEFRSVGGE